jgi:hypothetical protein
MESCHEIGKTSSQFSIGQVNTSDANMDSNTDLASKYLMFNFVGIPIVAATFALVEVHP